jgi:photosystem II stability/assembly factor-like uncharacterized protein
VQVSEDGGTNWRKVDKIAGVPDMTYVSRLETSPNDANTVYAAFDNHKTGDFKPYIYKSTDRGVTWTSVRQHTTSFLNGAFAVAVDPNTSAVYAGFDFEIDKSTDAGQTWTTVATAATLPSFGSQIRSLTFTATQPFATLYVEGCHCHDLNVCSSHRERSKRPLRITSSMRCEASREPGSNCASAASWRW